MRQFTQHHLLPHWGARRYRRRRGQYRPQPRGRVKLLVTELLGKLHLRKRRAPQNEQETSVRRFHCRFRCCRRRSKCWRHAAPATMFAAAKPDARRRQWQQAAPLRAWDGVAPHRHRLLLRRIRHHSLHNPHPLRSCPRPQPRRGVEGGQLPAKGSLWRRHHHGMPLSRRCFLSLPLFHSSQGLG